MAQAMQRLSASMAVMTAILLLTIAMGFSPVHATDADEMLADRALEARARAITAGLRCIVCQNQSVDDSNAPLARDLRRLVRERITAGDSDDQVIAYVVARYGEFALLRPRFAIHTLALWLTPLAVLLAILAYVAGKLGRITTTRDAIAPTTPLTAEQERRLDELVRDGDHATSPPTASLPQAGRQS